MPASEFMYQNINNTRRKGGWGVNLIQCVCNGAKKGAEERERKERERERERESIGTTLIMYLICQPSKCYIIYYLLLLLFTITKPITWISAWHSILFQEKKIHSQITHR